MKTHPRTPQAKYRAKRVNSRRKKLIQGTLKVSMTVEDFRDDTSTMKSESSWNTESSESQSTGTIDEVFENSSSTCSGESEEKISSPEKFRCAEKKHDEWSLSHLFEDPEERSISGSKPPKENFLCSTTIPEKPFQQFSEISDNVSSISFIHQDTGVEPQYISNQKYNLPQTGSKPPKENFLCSTTIPEKPFKQFSENSDNVSSISFIQQDTGVEPQYISNQKSKLPQTDQISETNSIVGVFHKSKKVKSYPAKTTKQNLQKNIKNKIPLRTKRNLPSFKKVQPDKDKKVLSKIPTKDFYEDPIDKLSEAAFFEEVHKSSQGTFSSVKTIEQSTQNKNINKVPLELETSLSSANKYPPNKCTEASSKSTNKESFDETLRANTLSEISSEGEFFHEMRKGRKNNQDLRKEIMMKKIPLKTKNKLPSLKTAPSRKCKKALPETTSTGDLSAIPKSNTLSGISSEGEFFQEMKKVKMSQVKKNNQGLRKKITTKKIPSRTKNKLPSLKTAPSSKYKKASPKTASTENLCATPKMLEVVNKHSARKTLMYDKFKPNSVTDKCTQEIRNQDTLERRSSISLSSTVITQHPEEKIIVIKSGEKDGDIPSRIVGRNGEGSLETFIVDCGNAKKSDGLNPKTKHYLEKRKTDEDVPEEEIVSTVASSELPGDFILHFESEDTTRAPLNNAVKDQELETVIKQTGQKTLKDGNTQIISKKKAANRETALPKKKKGPTHEITSPKVKKKIIKLRTYKETMIERESYNTSSSSRIVSELPAENIAALEIKENAEQNSLRSNEKEGQFQEKSETVKKHADLKLLETGNTKVISKKKATSQETALPKRKKGTTHEITSPKVKRKKNIKLRTHNQAMFERKPHNISSSSPIMLEHPAESVATLRSDEIREQSSFRNIEEEEEFQETRDMLESNISEKTKASKTKGKKMNNNKSEVKKGSSKSETVLERIMKYKKFLQTVPYDDLSLKKFRKHF